MGDVLTVGAYARIKVSINVVGLMEACKLSVSVMRDLRKWGDGHSWFSTYVANSKTEIRLYNTARRRLQASCERLSHWDRETNFPQQNRRQQRSVHHAKPFRATPVATDETLQRLYKFATASPDPPPAVPLGAPFGEPIPPTPPPPPPTTPPPTTSTTPPPTTTPRPTPGRYAFSPWVPNMGSSSLAGMGSRWATYSRARAINRARKANRAERHALDPRADIPNSTSTAFSNRPRRAVVSTAAAVGASAAIVGGTVLLAKVIRMLFGGSTPGWTVDALAKDAAKGALENAENMHELAKRMNDVHYFDHFQLYVNFLTDFARQIFHLVDRFEDAFYDLQQGTVSPLFISSQDIADALLVLESHATQNRMHLSVTSVGDALQLPAFGLKLNDSLALILPVPIYTDRLHLHKYAGTPLLIKDNHDNRVLAAPRPSHSLIAVATRASNHALLTKADLESCFTVYDTHMCASLPIRLKRESSCLGALFAANAQAINLQCPFETHPNTWHVARPTDDSFIITTAIDISATTHCPNGQSHSLPIKWGVSKVIVPPGCFTQTAHFLLPSTLTRFAEVEVHKELSWDMKIPLSWNYSHSLDLAKFAHQSELTAERLRQALDRPIERPPQQEGFFAQTLHTLWSGFLTLCVISLMAFFLYCACRNRGYFAQDAPAQAGAQGAGQAMLGGARR